MRRSLLARYVDWNWSWNIDSALRYAPVVRFILAAAGADALICDVGAGGRGGITSYGNLRAVGVDVSYAHQDTRGLVTRYPRLWPVCGTASALPFANGTFDSVVCIDTLEHVSQHTRPLLLDELFRIAKDDGWVIVGAPCGVEARRCDESMNRRYGEKRGSDHPWLKEHLQWKPILPTWFEKQVRLRAEHRFGDYCVTTLGNVSVGLSLFLGRLFSGPLRLEQLQRLLFRPLLPILVRQNAEPCYRRIHLVHGGPDHS